MVTTKTLKAIYSQQMYMHSKVDCFIDKMIACMHSIRMCIHKSTSYNFFIHIRNDLWN